MSLHDDILKLKISKDINKKVSDIKYQKLLNLVENHLFYMNFNKIDISQLEKIIKYGNIFISNQPTFTYYKIKNNQIIPEFYTMENIYCDINFFINEIIKKNSMHKIHIFTMLFGDIFRYAIIQDENFTKGIRKAKLLNIQNLNISFQENI